MTDTRISTAPSGITLTRGTTRRRFLTWSAVTAAAAFAPAMLGSADAQTGSLTGTTGSTGPGGSGSLGSAGHGADLFSLGIASGDPLPDSVILWTRLAPSPLEPGGGMPPLPVPVDWEVATDPSFRRIVARGTEIALPDNAHSVHVTVNGLQPWTEYHYRFRARGQITDPGRTKTTPAAGQSLPALSFAWASCQNWVNGLWTAYTDLADTTSHGPLDVILHLGDYIYEGDHRKSDARDTRDIDFSVTREPYTLDEYRLRYSLYKREPELQTAHRAAPWIVTMDDHEVDNNWAGEISQDDDDPAAFLQRRAQAFKAWWEHTPTRVQAPTGPTLTIYRQAVYGDLATFNVLDTRQYRSDQLYGDGSHVQDAGTADPARTMVGAQQENWLLDNLASSTTRWNILAHQTVMTDLAQMTDGERQVSMDGWSGYEASRHRILDGAVDRGVDNLMSIVGDIHRNTVSELKRDYRDGHSPAVGVEIAGTSISSGGDGEDLDAAAENMLATTPEIKLSSAQRGYVRTTVTPEKWSSDLRVVDQVTTPGGRMRTRATVTVPAGRPEISLD
ncbi:MAG: alkaline phosphatase D family protein [Corynebacterium nuruki]|nr:alkaline phosphatase D family protein [Corynebacterium nuruki]